MVFVLTLLRHPLQDDPSPLYCQRLILRSGSVPWCCSDQSGVPRGFLQALSLPHHSSALWARAPAWIRPPPPPPAAAPSGSVPAWPPPPSSPGGGAALQEPLAQSVGCPEEAASAFPAAAAPDALLVSGRWPSVAPPEWAATGCPRPIRLGRAVQGDWREESGPASTAGGCADGVRGCAGGCDLGGKAEKH